MMKNLLEKVGDAFVSVVGWAIFIAAMVVVSFWVGYSISHREITGFGQTMGAFAWVPMVWFAFPTMLIAFATTVLAFYLPLRFQSLWLYVAAPLVNLLTWITIVGSIVRFASGGKFWRW